MTSPTIKWTSTSGSILIGSGINPEVTYRPTKTQHGAIGKAEFQFTPFTYLNLIPTAEDLPYLEVLPPLLRRYPRLSCPSR